MRRSSAVLVVSICGALSASAPALAQEGRAGDVIPGKYIVVAEEGRDPAAVARWQNARDRQVLPVVNGFAATLDAAQVRALRASARVAYVEPDRVVTADATQTMDGNGDPWGLDRIDQTALPLSRTLHVRRRRRGAGVDAYIIDTGIAGQPPDFGGRAQNVLRRARRQRATTATATARTSPARSAARRTASPRASQLRGVRVLGCTGSGSTSGIIRRSTGCAPTRVKPAVANMSLGGGRSTSLNTRGEQPGQLRRVHRGGGRQREPERLQRLPRLGHRRLHDGRVGPDRPEGVVLELGLVRGRLRAGRVDQVGLAVERDADDQRHVDGDARTWRASARSTSRPSATRRRRSWRAGSTPTRRPASSARTRAGRRTAC